MASDAIALDASSVWIDGPIVWATQRCVPLGLRRPVGLAAQGRQNLHEQRGWSFNATGRNLRRLRDDDQIRLDDIVRRQDDIDGRVEHLSPTAGLEELIELALQSFRDPLVQRTGRRRHQELPVQNLIAVPIRRYCRVVRVVELLFQPTDHVCVTRPNVILSSSKGHWPTTPPSCPSVGTLPPRLGASATRRPATRARKCTRAATASGV